MGVPEEELWEGWRRGFSVRYSVNEKVFKPQDQMGAWAVNRMGSLKYDARWQGKEGRREGVERKSKRLTHQGRLVFCGVTSPRRREGTGGERPWTDKDVAAFGGQVRFSRSQSSSEGNPRSEACRQRYDAGKWIKAAVDGNQSSGCKEKNRNMVSEMCLLHRDWF